MTIEIHMPALSPTMEEGNLAKWHVKEGDDVTSGDVIAEIETDKATMEVESIDDGVVGKIAVAEGTEGVKVGTVIAVLLEEGESASDIKATAAAAPAATPAKPAESAAKAEAEQAEPPKVAPATQAPAAGGRIKASPLAKRLAKDAGLDLSTLTGSGPGGRIVKADVESTSKTAAAPAAAAVGGAVAVAVAGPEGDAPFEEVKLSNMRKTIARRLTESKQSVPHFYLTVDIELDKLLKLRAEVNAQLDPAKVSVNDFIIKACALALRDVPEANVQFGGDVMRHYSRSDISVAVATDGGLVTPVVRAAEGKSIGAIAAEMKELASKARDNKLMPEDYTGGTFTISNMGMMGIKEFSAVINPPQGAILAVGAGIETPVVRDGAITTATMMSVTLSCDHRAIDGAVGAKLLGAIKGYLEKPLSILV